ncbi:MAG: hypothetical protein QF793_02035 [Candidatus Peribacteraceae bacterium]|nr:hypothetical protein [bacterium]MDP6561682.1 hypothetical protein [Candidatus Peribacteraceae bacterium]|tara:strand:+ start:47775 stop:48404 length:630 start_codon:yes stop_codon:yes gene_type:complete
MFPVNRFAASKRNSAPLPTVPETDFSREAEIRAKQIEFQLGIIMDNVVAGAHSNLCSNPKKWLGVSHPGPPYYELIATDLDADHILTFQQIGSNPNFLGKGLRQDRTGSLLHVNNGDLLLKGFMQFGTQRISESELPTPESVNENERKSFIYPSPDEWVVGSAKDGVVFCTTVSTRDKMFNLQDTDTSGFVDLQPSRKDILLKNFESFN